MAQQGFQIPMLRLADADGGGSMANQLYNKYTPPSIFQELKWAFDILHRDDTVRAGDVEPLLYRRQDGLCYDLHLLHQKPEPFETVLERRKLVYGVFKEAFDTDVVVMTLGLIEAFWDRENQAYVLIPPNLLGRGSGRFEFERLTFSESYGFINKALDLLDSTGAKKHLITTSPVTLHRTFTGEDVIVANLYSKSVLRAVAGQIVEERDNVDYFPSFETVMLTRQPYVWNDDLQHVAYSFVGRIVARVSEQFVEQAKAPEGAGANDALIAEQVLHFSTLMQNNQFDAAGPIYDRLPFDPLASGDLIFHTHAARLMRSREDREKARAHALLATKGVSTWPREQIRAAAVLHWLGETEAADRLVHRLLVDSDDMPSSAYILLQIAQPEIGLENTLASSKRYFQGPRAYSVGSSYAGDLALQLGRPDESIEHYSEAIALDSQDPHPLVKLGNLLVEQGRLPEAVKRFRDAIALDAENFQLRRRLGYVLMKTGDIPGALVELERAISAQPGDPLGHVVYARALRLAGKIEQSLEQMQIAQRLDPSNDKLRSEVESLTSQPPAPAATGGAKSPQLPLRQINQLIQQKRFAEAVEPLKGAVSEDPDNAQLRRRLSYVLVECNRYDEAVQQSSEAVRLDPNDAKTRINYGRLLRRTKRFDAALEALEVAKSLDPADDTVNDLIAQIRRQRDAAATQLQEGA